MKKTQIKRKTPLRAKKYWNSTKTPLRSKTRLTGQKTPQKRSPRAVKKKDPTVKLKNILYKLSHDYIRRRDGMEGDMRGYCFDCGNYAEGRNFQCGHFVPDAAGGAILRYHPHNMHGQAAGCNMKHQQESVKINYTLKMINKYGIDYVEYLKSLKNVVIKADSVFYQTMIDLYKEGDELKIVTYLTELSTGTSS